MSQAAEKSTHATVPPPPVDNCSCTASFARVTTDNLRLRGAVDASERKAAAAAAVAAAAKQGAMPLLEDSEREGAARAEAGRLGDMLLRLPSPPPLPPPAAADAGR